MKYICYLLLVSMSFNKSDNETYVKTFYENGSLESEGWVKQDKKEDYWKFYYNNGRIKKEGHFSNSNPIEYWYFYAPNGLKESEGHFINGKKTNWWVFYDDLGKVNHKCQLKFNQKNGYCLKYKNGDIISASKYNAGKKIKEWYNLKDFKKENNLLNLR